VIIDLHVWAGYGFELYVSAALRRRLSSAAFCQLKAAAIETDALLLLVWGCGTVCQLIWDKLTLTLNSLNGSWRHFCLGVEHCALWLLNCTFLIILLTYLLTWQACLWITWMMSGIWEHRSTPGRQYLLHHTWMSVELVTLSPLVTPSTKES